MVAEALFLLPYQMSTVVNSFLSNELASNRILFESQLPVFGKKVCLHANEQTSDFPTFANNPMFSFPNRNRYSSFSNDRSEPNRSLSKIVLVY